MGRRACLRGNKIKKMLAMIVKHKPIELILPPYMLTSHKICLPCQKRVLSAILSSVKF